MKKRILISAVSLALILSSCGIQQEQLNAASDRLAKLEEAGLPDSLLIDAKMGLFEAKKAKKDNIGSAVKENYELAIAAIENAEAVLTKSIQEQKPVVQQRLLTLTENTKSQLTGRHVAPMDTLLDSATALLGKDWVIEAEKMLNQGDSLFTKLTEEQKVAKKLKPRIIGTWKYDMLITNSADKTVRANEQKIFTFYRNGKAKFIEQKKGKSSPDLKEDWRFETYGTWDLKGDTIHLKADRFACTKQNFQELRNQNGKLTWVKKSQPTYDSTITDGSQDRHIAYPDLIEDFKK